MKKFKVTMPALASVTLEVEAQDQDEAIKKFYEARPEPNPEDWSYEEDLYDLPITSFPCLEVREVPEPEPDGVDEMDREEALAWAEGKARQILGVSLEKAVQMYERGELKGAAARFEIQSIVWLLEGDEP